MRMVGTPEKMRIICFGIFRTISGEMLHGSFNGVDSTQANLKVDDLGLDKET